jgi:hypothetical protein
MQYVTISGDIVSSTSLKASDRAKLEGALHEMLLDLEVAFGVYGRILKGDYIECAMPDSKYGLQVALAIKSFVKAVPIDISAYVVNKKRAKHFKEHGIRIAIGFGGLDRFDPSTGVMDGEAIYLSGRLINAMSTYNKERIVIKNTLFFASKDEDLNANWEAILGLLDVLLTKATARQSEVLYLKLLGNDETTIAKRLGIDQSVVNRHSTSVGWNAVETAVSYFQNSFST